MKEQLKRYIKEEEKKGIPLEQIEQALLDAGHKQNVIDEVFKEFKQEKAGQKAKLPSQEVQKDLVQDVSSSIKDFFGKLQGKQVQEVKNDLKKHPSEKIIEESIEEYEVEKETYIIEGFSFFIFLVALVILTLYTAGSTGEEVLFVAVGFSPAFLNSFISFALIKFAEYVPLFMLIPVVVGGGFFALGNFSELSIFSHMEVEALAIVNTVIALFFNLLLVVTSSIKPRAMHEFEKEPIETKKKPKEIIREQEFIEKPKESKKHIDALKDEFDIK
jgi:hypothetical protein